MADDRVSMWKTDVPMEKDTPITARWLKDPIDLDLLRQASKKLNVSINDLLVSCMTGALQQYTKYREKQAGTQLSAELKKMLAVLWVSLRGISLEQKKEEKISLTNKLGCVYLDLPLSVSDMKTRIELIKQMTSQAYTSPDPLVSYGLMMLIGVLPPLICRLIFNSAGFKVSISFSNLPGPTKALQFSGNNVTKFLFFVPPSRTLGSFISILSYNGRVMFGMSTDHRLIPDPQMILEGFKLEVDNLVNLTSTSKIN